MMAFVPTAEDMRMCAPYGARRAFCPRTHGSAVFTRGETQVMDIVTLGPIGDGQTLDGISEDTFKEIYAPVQYAAVLHRRSAAYQKCKQARDWTRRTG